MHRTLSLTLLAIALAAVEQAPTIIVTAERGESELWNAPQSVSVVESDAIDRRGGGSETVDWFRELPGVGVFKKYGGYDGNVPDVRIRGLDSAYTQMVIDGIPFNDPVAINGEVNLSFLAPAGVERVELLRGSQSGLYGSRAIGGVAGVRTLRPTAMHQAEASASYGSFATMQGTVQATGPIGAKAGYAVAVEGMQTDGFTTLTPDAEGSPDGYEADALSRTSYSARLEAQPLAGASVYAAAMGSKVEQDYDDGYHAGWPSYAYLPEVSADDPIAGNQVVSNRFAAGGTFKGERLRLSADAAWTGSERENTTIYGSNYFGGVVPDPVLVEYRGRETFLSATAGWRADHGLEVMVGSDARFQQASQHRSDVGGLWSDDDRIVGAFVQATWSHERCELGVVGRQDQISDYGSQQSGRASGAVFFAERTLKLRGSLSNGYRSPSLYERFGTDSALFYEGNPDLKVESSRSYELGADWLFLESVDLSATWFRTDFEDKISWDFPPFPQPSTMQNLDGRSESSGVEIGAGITDISSSGIDVAGDYTGLTTADPRGDEFAFAPNHRGGVRVTATQQAAARVRLWESLRVERTTPYYASTGERERVDGYTLASAAIGVTLDGRYEASLRIENLTDEAYVVNSSFGQTYATMPRSYYVSVKATF